ncbi:hypothetical protein PAPHI01_1579 [Pancytospora philotis]|nr:hypothetical protein PAPHI01_1579 [Pancytospora philotis]
MRMLVMIPSGTVAKDYTVLPTPQGVRYSCLIRYEDEAKGLQARIARLLKGQWALLRRAGAKSAGIKEASALPSWSRLIDRESSLERVLETLERDYAELAGRHSCLAEQVGTASGSGKAQARPSPARPAESTAPNDERCQFIACFSVKVRQSRQKAFLRDMHGLSGRALAVQLSEAHGLLEYRVCCLGSTADAVHSGLSKSYETTPIKNSLSALSEAPRAQPSLNHNVSNDTVSNKQEGPCVESINKLVDETAQLYLDASAFIALVESLQRYGAPGRIMYKITAGRASRCTRELRATKKALQKAGLIDGGPDDEEYPFTHILLEDFAAA